MGVIGVVWGLHPKVMQTSPKAEISPTVHYTLRLIYPPTQPTVPINKKETTTS